MLVSLIHSCTLYSTVQYSTVHYSTEQYSTARRSTIIPHTFKDSNTAGEIFDQNILAFNEKYFDY